MRTQQDKAAAAEVTKAERAASQREDETTRDLRIIKVKGPDEKVIATIMLPAVLFDAETEWNVPENDLTKLICDDTRPRGAAEPPKRGPPSRRAARAESPLF